MKTSRIASTALAVALAFGAAACDSDGTATSDGFGGVDDGTGELGTTDPGTTDTGTTDTGTTGTTDTGTTGTDG